MKYFIYMAAFIAVFAPGAAHAVAEACITCVSFDGGEPRIAVIQRLVLYVTIKQVGQ